MNKRIDNSFWAIFVLPTRLIRFYQGIFIVIVIFDTIFVV